MVKKLSEKQKEQQHLTFVIDKIKTQMTTLKQSIKTTRHEAKALNAHFFDDVKLDYDDYATSMETALSIRQQQQLLAERQNAWQHRAKAWQTLNRLVKKPYFARVDFRDPNEDAPETIYIGLGSFADQNDHFLIYDWRAPISSIYYDGKLGKVSYNAPDGIQTVDMTKKRQFVIESGKIVNMFDTNESIGDQMLVQVLNEHASTQMKTIVATIQREQNKIIRNTKSELLFVQGAAGSGKTSAILQRIAYLLYRYRGNLTSGNVIMFSPNQLFNDYVENVLPEMGEQNMVQMTYWQFVARRVPGLRVQTLFEQFEDPDVDDAVATFKNSLAFFKLTSRYAAHLNQSGVAFKDLYFKEAKKPFLSKSKIHDLYYSFNQNYDLANRMSATKESLITWLNHKIEPETRKAWVSRELESLSQEDLLKLYDRPDQEFESSDKETHFLSRKLVVKALKPINRRINQHQFLNTRLQYLRFLQAVPQMIDLSKWGIDDTSWEADTARVKEGFKARQIKMSDVSPYLYLYDLVTGRRTEWEMRYAFIDEIQDYTPYQLAYLKYNFPRAKFTMLGDLNQAIFTKDQSKTLLNQISTLFDPDKTDVVQLTKSYRSTKPITAFTKQILRQGEKIEAFDRPGPLPGIYACQDEAHERDGVRHLLQRNDAAHLTSAIITKDLASAKRLFADLKQQGVKTTLIGSANQRLVEGDLILPSYLAKGLEFDAVILWETNAATYHRQDETQLMYTIASRAMYRLDLVYTDQLSPLLRLKPKTYEAKTF